MLQMGFETPNWNKELTDTAHSFTFRGATGYWTK